MYKQATSVQQKPVAVMAIGIVLRFLLLAVLFVLVLVASARSQPTDQYLPDSDAAKASVTIFGKPVTPPPQLSQQASERARR